MIRKVTFLSNPILPGKSPILLFRNPFAGIVLKKGRSILTAEWSFLGLESQTLETPFKSEASVNLKKGFWVVCIFKGF